MISPRRYGLVLLLGCAFGAGATSLFHLPPANAITASRDEDELLKKIDKLLDEKLAKVKEEISKDVKGQIDANNRQVISTALTLQKTLRDALGEVALRALNFERAVKIMLIQTPLFNDHGAAIGTEQEDLEEQALKALGLKKGEATQVTKIIPATPAEAAGLREGDVIVWSAAEAKNYLPGDKRMLPVIRKGQRINVFVWLSCKKCWSELCPFWMSAEPKRVLGVRSDENMVVLEVVAGSAA